MTSYSIAGGRLLADGAPVPYRGTPNLGGAVNPRFLVMHFTAGGYAGAVDWLCNPSAKASAHLVIGERGEVTQLAPFDRATWHAGKSSWRDVLGSLNPVSIGIELANYGELDGGPGCYTFSGRAVPDDRVIVAAHRNGGGPQPWHTYPPAQIAAALGIAQALHAAYGFEDVVGHDQIAPGRKTDPGPAFDMAAFRAAVLGGGAVAPPSVRPAAPSDRSPLALQRALNHLGFGPIAEDGDVGGETRAATRAFQRAKGLDDDGVAGKETWRAIDAAIGGG